MSFQGKERQGGVKQITSHANPIIKEIKGLVAQRKHRRDSGLFVAEGLKLASDALKAGWGVRYLAMGPEARENQAALDVAAKAKAQGALILEVSNAILTNLTRRDNPQMVVGVYEQKVRGLDTIDVNERKTWICLDRVRDPGNLGTIIRTGDAVGAAGVVLIGDTTDPFAVEAVRATMGSLFHMPLIRCREDEFIDWRRNWPGLVVGTHLRGTMDYREPQYKEPLLLVMGNEQAGLSDALADSCNTLVKIPQEGQADSLNLAIATAVMLFEVRRDMLQLAK
ncbi:TrmH family RNA methyltransferase [Polycladidibacter stylochi]|uniref:TrmH family RNA methyltransferase n=1 Tax=Polycladidibacter stylochi TaxID=1807766 RepID=UPI00082AABC3|nr:RNA methyltransferase [Pseudovibrio stylochi]